MCVLLVLQVCGRHTTGGAPCLNARTVLASDSLCNLAAEQASTAALSNLDQGLQVSGCGSATCHMASGACAGTGAGASWQCCIQQPQLLSDTRFAMQCYPGHIGTARTCLDNTKTAFNSACVCVRVACLQGYGVYVFGSGQRYEGHWEKGKKHGWSIYTVETGQRWAGSWVEGKPQWVHPLVGEARGQQEASATPEISDNLTHAAAACKNGRKVRGLQETPCSSCGACLLLVVDTACSWLHCKGVWLHRQQHQCCNCRKWPASMHKTH